MVGILQKVAVRPVTSVRHRRLEAPKTEVLSDRSRGTRLSGSDVLLCSILTLVALVARLAYRVGTLEQWDTVNFTLAVDRFDPALHQPHPPGQILFVGTTRILRIWTGDAVQAVALTNALLGALALIPLYALARRWTDRSTAWLAGLLFIVNPCLWVHSVRPMSDGAALFPILTAVALLLTEGRRALWGYPAMGFALGFRQQVLFPLMPFLLYIAWVHARRYRWRWALGAGVLFLLGALAWWVPTVMAMGGIAAYSRAAHATWLSVWEQDSLIQNWSGSRLQIVFLQAFVTIWGWPWMAALAWALIGLGGVVLARNWAQTLPWWLLTGPAILWRCLMLWDHNRYAILYLPFLLVPLALGLYQAGRWAWTRWPAFRVEVLGLGALVLVGSQVMFIFPTIDTLRRHHAPTLKAVQWITERAETDQTLVITDDAVVRRHMDYYGPRFGLTVRPEMHLTPDILRAYPRWFLLTTADRPTLGAHLVAQWEWRPGMLFRLEPQRNLERVYLYEFVAGPYLTFTGWYEWEKERHPFRYFRWLGRTGGEVHLFPVERQTLRIRVTGQVPAFPKVQPPCKVDVGVGTHQLATLEPGFFNQVWTVHGSEVRDATLRIWWRPRRAFRPIDVGETIDPRWIGCVRLFSIGLDTSPPARPNPNE
ncbi:MAG: hypothetical protein NZ742_10135 [Acidobacteria bacterium]|nr:hypothetical protein [Acidobacteriota bacterium]MDW7985101.1 hypothetical protein [Acidobacteriota bacterium]